jgi:CubicO group peptidase (beta-lactamase class C family)
MGNTAKQLLGQVMYTCMLCMIVVVSFACSKHDSTPGPAPHYDFSSVDKYIEDNIDVYKGNVAVLVSQNGQVIYRKEVNLNITTNRLVASASKWLSGAVIMALVDERKLSLNDTVGKFLPIFSRYGKGHITIRQLFSHTSGFPGDSPEGFVYKRTLTMARAVDSLAVYTAMIHPAGTTFNYGQVSMQIAGSIAEVVSGKSWQALFREKIAIPCNMQASYLLVSPQNPLVAGGVRTNARDYLNFVEMIVNKGMYNNKRVLSEAAVADMLKDQTNGAVIESTPYATNPYSPHPSGPVRYGIGNWLDVVDGAGNIVESSSPGLFGTHPWQDSKHHMAGIIFTKTDPKISNATSLKIREMIRKIVEK